MFVRQEMIGSEDESFRSFDSEVESDSEDDDSSDDFDPKEDAFAKLVASLPAGTTRK